MRGGIYCGVCGRPVAEKGCNLHPGRFRAKFGGSKKRTDSYGRAEQWLWHVRYQSVVGTFDRRDWMKEAPLGCATLLGQFVEIKRDEVSAHTLRTYQRWSGLAVEAWGQRNVKEISYADLEDLLKAQPVAAKTRANIKSFLHSFWSWLRKRKVLSLDQTPEFPEIHFELGFRKLIDKDTQIRILEKIRELSWIREPKVYIGMRILSSSIMLRPGEMIRALERDFDLVRGVLTLQPAATKERKAKVIPLLWEDVEMIKALPRGFPDLPFFRHPTGHGGILAGTPYGPKYLYVWWKRACAILGVEGVDMYGGLRHSSATALREHRTPEEIKKGSGHSTSKAFDRYYQMDLEQIRAIYADTRRGGTRLEPDSGIVPEGKVLEFKKE